MESSVNNNFIPFHPLKWVPLNYNVTQSTVVYYVYREQDSDNDFWQPGDVLPVASGPQSQNTATLTDVLQSFQANMEKQLSSIGRKLNEIQVKLDEIDHQQGILEQDIKSLKSGSVFGKPSGSGQGRRKITPTALQVIITS